MRFQDFFAHHAVGDVVLDLQAVFTRTWESSGYPELLRYDGPPPGPLTPDEIAKLDQVSALKPEYPGWMLARQAEGRVPAAKK